MSLELLNRRLEAQPWCRCLKDISDEFTVRPEEHDDTPGVLGRGTFAEVRRCERQDGRTFAVKSISKKGLIGNDRRIRHVLVEVASTVVLSHECLVKTHEVVLTRDHVHLVMNMCPGVTLHAHLQTVPDGRMQGSEAAYVMKQLLGALSCLHDHSIVHRDVKPSNIIVDPATLHTTLIDIGLGKYVGPPSSFPDGQDVLSSPVSESLAPFHDERSVLATPDAGTTSYLAVEGIAGKVESDKLDLDGWNSPGKDLFKLDVYAAGVTGFVILTGRLPYARTPNSSLAQLRRLMKTHPAVLPLASSGSIDPLLPQAARDVVQQMLSHLPTVRPTVAQCLTNVWVADAQPRSDEYKSPVDCPVSVDLLSEEASYHDVIRALNENDAEMGCPALHLGAFHGAHTTVLPVGLAT